MPRDYEKGSNFKYGIVLDINGDGGLTDEKFIPGQRFEVEDSNIAAANIPGLIFIAPYPCKLIRAYERRATVAGQAGTMQIERCPSGTAPGSGTNVLVNAIDLTTVINTNTVVLAVAPGITTNLVAGDSLGTKLASGASTSYAGGTVTCVMEWM